MDTAYTRHSPLSSTKTSGPQCVALKSPSPWGWQSHSPASKLVLIQKMSTRNQWATGVSCHCYLLGSKPTPSLSSECGSETTFFTSFTRTRIISQQFWWSALSNIGTLRSSHLPPVSITIITQVWDFSRPYLGAVGWPGTGLAGPWFLNIPFTHHIHSFLSITIKCRSFKSQISFHGVATKNCGIDGLTPS